MKKFLILILCLGLAGCATMGHLATPSGRPEVFIEEATKKDAIDSSVGLFIANGWQIEKTTDYIVQVIQVSNSMTTDFLWGSDYDFHQTWYRMIFTFVQESDGVRVLGVQQVVANRGTGFERVLELKNQKAYEATQSYLRLLRTNLAKD